MKLRKLKITTLLISILIISSSITANAHSGRTDANGGHRDNKNKSGLGSYHYHCGGHEAHLHTNGCPYGKKPATSSNSNNSVSKTNKNSTSINNKSTTNTVEKKNNDAEIKAKKAEEERIAKEAKEREEKETAKKEGYKNGYDDGFAKKEDLSSQYNKNYKEEYIASYKEGYISGKDTIEAEIEIARKEGYNTGYRGDNKDNNEYKSELITAAYNSGYNDGYNDYKNDKLEEYKSKGISDATEKKKAMSFDDSIDSEFKEAYISAYNSKKEELNATNEDGSIGITGGVIALGAIGAGTVVYKKKKSKKSE